MSIPFGIFDFAVYAVPGSLYFLVLLLAADAAGLGADVWTWILHPTPAVSIAALLGCYLLGFVTYSFSRFRLWFEPRYEDAARERFVKRNPQLKNRAFVTGHTYVRQALVDAHNAQWASSIASMSASGLMCQNCATACLLLALMLYVRGIDTARSGFLTGCALAVIAAAVMLRRAGTARLIWAEGRTLECAACIPDVDRVYAPPESDATATGFDARY